jgi:hypothetical protein
MQDKALHEMKIATTCRNADFGEPGRAQYCHVKFASKIER